MADSDNTKASDKPDYEQTIQQEIVELAAKRETIRQKLLGKQLDDPETMAIAKETVLDLTPDAALQIRYLINHAESETIRKDLAKWVLGLAMNERGKLDEEDEMTNLLNELTAGKKTTDSDG
jgi:hypothetical protein